MYLRSIDIGATWITFSEERASFNVSTLCLTLEVLRALPRRKIVLDQLKKLNVFIGDAGPDGVDYEKWQGVGNVYVRDFDFRFYFSLPRATQQDAVLRLHEAAVRLVANRAGSDASLCLSAIEHVRSLGLPLPDISVQEYMGAFKRDRRAGGSKRDVEV
jgi:hypothetical protein